MAPHVSEGVGDCLSLLFMLQYSLWKGDISNVLPAMQPPLHLQVAFCHQPKLLTILIIYTAPPTENYTVEH